MLVAGGLGERLGYSGIKIALPTDLARNACFLQVLLAAPLHAAAPVAQRCHTHKDKVHQQQYYAMQRSQSVDLSTQIQGMRKRHVQKVLSLYL